MFSMWQTLSGDSQLLPCRWLTYLLLCRLLCLFFAPGAFLYSCMLRRLMRRGVKGSVTKTRRDRANISHSVRSSILSLGSLCSRMSLMDMVLKLNLPRGERVLKWRCYDGLDVCRKKHASLLLNRTPVYTTDSVVELGIQPSELFSPLVLSSRWSHRRRHRTMVSFLQER